jgi:hypothetical protein
MRSKNRAPDPRDREVRALLINCGDQCAFPGCGHRVANDHQDFIAEIAHICAASPGGERYDPSMTNDQRRSYDNLLILCHAHHVETDNVKRFPVEAMREMKRSHEDGVRLRRKLVVTPALLEQALRSLDASASRTQLPALKSGNLPKRAWPLPVAAVGVGLLLWARCERDVGPPVATTSPKSTSTYSEGSGAPGNPQKRAVGPVVPQMGALNSSEIALTSGSTILIRADSWNAPETNSLWCYNQEYNDRETSWCAAEKDGCERERAEASARYPVTNSCFGDARSLGLGAALSLACDECRLAHSRPLGTFNFEFRCGCTAKAGPQGPVLVATPDGGLPWQVQLTETSVIPAGWGRAYYVPPLGTVSFDIAVFTQMLPILLHFRLRDAGGLSDRWILYNYSGEAQIPELLQDWDPEQMRMTADPGVKVDPLVEGEHKERAYNIEVCPTGQPCVILDTFDPEPRE